MEDAMGRTFALGFATIAGRLPSATCPSKRAVCRRRPRVALACCASKQSYEPVESGVMLPPFMSADALSDETAWLADAVTNWLETEWCQPEPAPVHDEIGQRVARIYERQRLEGEDDLSGILLAVGQELEGFDMSEAFVGPFNIANKVAELLIAHSVGPRESLPKYVRDPSAPVWSPEKEAELLAEKDLRRVEAMAAEEEGTRAKENETNAAAGTTGGVKTSGDIFEPRYPGGLADRFDRFVFLKRILDDTLDADVVSGALAVVVGFAYDSTSGTWSGAGVTDEFFSRYGDTPPNILLDMPALDYLSKVLAEDDEDGERAEALEVVIDSYHGADISKIQRAEGDVNFLRREIVVKYLHMYGEF